MLRSLCCSLLIVLLLFGCESRDVWKVHNKVEIAGDWNQEDVIRLALTPTKEGESRIYIEVSHTPDFSYENIYLKYILSQQGKVLSEEMVSIPLMSKEGLWTGDRQGKNYSSNQLIGNFDLTETITLEVQQHSREAWLGGVMSIGVGMQ